MHRMLWVVIGVFGCQGAPPPTEVSLGGAPFEVTDAVFISTLWPNNGASTFVVFGATRDLCRAFDDEANLCNARTVPDVHDGVIAGLARPTGFRASLGWLVLRSATEGPALVVSDQSGLATPGATLTEGRMPPVRALKNRAVIESLVAGDSATASFQSELSDGRAFRGRIEATWCPALEMVRRHNEQVRAFPASPPPARTGFVQIAQCGNERIEEHCVTAADGSSQCTCFNGDQTSTCVRTQDGTCCSRRFGD